MFVNLKYATLELMLKVKGFTLIELLIAISIIVVLSMLAFTIFRNIQSRARDSIRKSDLNRLATALEIYFQEKNRFVATVNADYTISDLISCPTDTIPGTFHTLIIDKMSDRIVPTDPKTKIDYCYKSSANGQSYALCSDLENSSDPDYVTSPANCPTIPNINYHYVLTPK